MGTNAVICAGPNHLGTNRAKWTAASEYSASFSDDNLALRAPSKLWRSENSNPFLTWAYGYHDVPGFTGAYADSVAAIAHNLRPATGRWRARLFSSAISALPPAVPNWVAPTGSSGATNIAAGGNHTNVDDDLSTDADDGNELAPSSASTNWSIVLTFPTPASVPIVGSSTDRRQAFVLKAYYGGGSGDDLDPSTTACARIQVELLESGGVVRDLGTKQVSRGSASNQYLIWEWDATELGTASGANVELRITGIYVSGLHARVRVAGWWNEPDGFTFQDPTTGLIADSGWLTAVDDLAAASPFGAFYPVRALRAETSFHRFETVGYTGSPVGVNTKTNYLQLLFMDDHTPTVLSGLELGRTPITPDGYIQLGVPWLSRGLELEINRELGDLVTVDDRSVRLETYGGNLGGTKLARRRIVSMPSEWMKQVDAMALLDRIAWEGSILDPLVISLLPQSTTERRHTTIYGVPLEPQTVLRAVSENATYNRGFNLRVLEWR